ncbi:MAG: ATP-dependent DNA ligase [Candidatus Micrarchaeia archaeon]
MRFAELAGVFEQLEAITSRIQMTNILAELLAKAKPAEAHILAYLLEGELRPSFENVRFNVADKLMTEAIAQAYGVERADVEKAYKEKGDLGLVASALAKKGKSELELEEVYKRFMEIAQATGAGSQEKKISLLAALFRDATPLEAKYIARIVLGKLRMGVGAYTFLDALSVAKKGTKELRQELENAYNVSSDLGAVAEAFLEKGLKKISEQEVRLFRPIRPALAQRLSSAEEIIKRMGTCAVEPKYDGFRVQVHKKGEEVKLYSRNLEETTYMFPEIVEATKKQVKAREAIFEGEALAYDESTGTFQPFQVTIQRKRKHGVAEKAEELPLKLFAFDLLYRDGESFLGKPYTERKRALREMLRAGETIEVAQEKIVNKPEEIDALFNEYVSEGLEGILAKDPKSIYSAGARGYDWIKLKRSYKGKLADTVDVAIVGYFKGKGKRAALGIGALVGAVFNKQTGNFETIAKIGSGLTEEQTRELKRMLDAISLRHKPPNLVANLEADVWVTPRYVIEVRADEITRSPVHTCAAEKGMGLSLRFPRVVGFVRADKKAEDATTTQEVLQMFKGK